MRAGAREESVESRGGTARNDGLHSVDGGGVSNGSSSETQGISFGTGSTFGGNEGGITEKAWFAPVGEDVFSSASPDVISFGECKDGVCPVPWAKDPVFTIEGPPVVAPDEVNHPPHYTDGGGIECIEAIEAQLTVEEYRGYLKGNIAKYVWRERHKGEVQSLKKAQWYLDRLVQLLEV